MSFPDPRSSPSRDPAAGAPRRLLLIASSGGHIFEMFCLKDFWGDKDRAWVSFPTADAKYLLQDEKEVHWAAHPTVRSVPNLLRNLVLAERLLRTIRPDMILTTGSGVAAPFLWLARLRGIPTVFVESITRITEISLTARMVKPFTTRMLVQWPELVARYPGVEHHGRIV
jgi:beta-1,4-N-acetylglucosaminyltransferase